MSVQREAVRAVITRWIEDGWQRGREAVVDQLHALGFVDHDPGGRPPDGEGFKRGIRELYAAFPDFHARVEEIVVDEARGTAAVRWTATGTHSATYLGAAATGRRIAFKGIELLRLDADCRIAERWGEWDGLELLGQLGVR